MTPGFQISQDEFALVLRRAGYPAEKIQKIIAELPDPIDVDRDSEVLERYGLSRDRLTDKMGGSP